MPLSILSSVCLVWLLVVQVGVAAGEDTSTNVPLDHWVYGYLERFEALGFLTQLGDGIKPFSRNEINTALGQIADQTGTGRWLTEVERVQLDQLRLEFDDEGIAKSRGGRLRSGQPLWRYAHERGTIYFDPLVRQQTDIFNGLARAENEQIFRERLGATVRGNIGEYLGFRMSFEQTREHGTRTYKSRDDIYESRFESPQLKDGVADYHDASALISFALPFLDIQLGKDRVDWGPFRDNLGLSRGAPSFDMLRLKARYGAFKLVSITGVLRPCPDRFDAPNCAGISDSTITYSVNGLPRRLERSKYLAAHRLEVAIAPWFDLGIHEMVIYGDRGLEVTYLNPIMFYWAAQSFLGDKDNVLMGFDVDIHPGNGVRVYGAYLLDDLAKLKIFSDDFVNKFSFQGGGQWIDPLGLKNAQLRLEYTRIEPWIYTHKFPINTYRHFDMPLGHSLAPNSDQWQLDFSRQLSPGWLFKFYWERVRHGENVVLPDGSILNVGGDLHLGWRPGDERQTKRFLDGNTWRRSLVGGGLEGRLFPRLSLGVNYGYQWGDNLPLPPRWDDNIGPTQRSGYGDGNQHLFSVQFRYGYH